MKRKLLLVLFMLVTAGWAYGDDSNVATLEPIVVTPDRAVVEEAMTPSDVTVISQQEIQDSGAQNVGELLDGSVGVHVYNDGEVKTDKVDIRGFADTSVSNILVLVDGHKVNSIDISGPDLTQIPIEEIERIEVIRGASSVLYGDNAVGGVVNIITKKGSGAASGSVEYDGGSYGTSTEDVTVGGAEKGLSYQMNQKYADSDGYRGNSNMLAKDYDGKFSYSITDALTLNSDLVWHQDEYGLPGDLTPEEFSTIGRRGSSFPQNYDHASTQDKMFSLGLADKSFLGDLSIDTSYRNKDTYAYFDEDPYGTTDVKYDITTLGVLGKDVYKGTILGHDFQTVAGVDYYNSQNKILGGGSGVSEDFDDIVVQMDELGVYANNTLWVTDKLSVNAGYRYEYAQYTFNDKGNDLKTIKDANAPVGGAGVIYEYAPGSNVHASVQQTFRFLATDEWYSAFTGLDTNLKQQTGIQYEVGIKHNLNDIASLTVTPYWINNKNEIFYDPYNVAFGSNNNYGHTQRIGIEFGQETDLLKVLQVWLDKLTFNTNFTYQDPIFIGGPYNHRILPGVPNTQASVGLDVGFLKHFIFTASEKFTGQEYAIDDVTNETARNKQFWITDLKLSYELKNMGLFVRVDNLFNEYYNDYTVMSTVDTDKVYYPASGRTVSGGINFKF